MNGPAPQEQMGLNLLQPYLVRILWLTDLQNLFSTVWGVNHQQVLLVLTGAPEKTRHKSPGNLAAAAIGGVETALTHVIYIL